MAMIPNPLPGLAADPGGASLGLRLPPGSLVDTTFDGPRAEPMLWLADAAAAPGDWARLVPARRGAGLQPLLICRGDSNTQGPHEWGLTPDRMTYPGDHDGEEILTELWEAATSDLYALHAEVAREAPPSAGSGEADGLTPDEILGPFGASWPGLADAPVQETGPDARAAELAEELSGPEAWLDHPRLALVPARRSADVPAVIGWAPVNYEGDAGVLSAVLRSWEDRFGIRVVALTLDRMILSVAAPPSTKADADAIAAEHFAFCPDNILQGRYTHLREYAVNEVLGRRVWSFWWD